MQLERITKTKDYSRISKTSKKLHSRSFLILYNLLTEHDSSRFGLTVSKRVGNAVKRNRCKRLIRAILKDRKEEINPSIEFIIIAKPTFLEYTYSDLKREFDKAIERLK